MACPGVAVFNTGDSLVTVDIRVDPNESSRDLFSMPHGRFSMPSAGGAICPASSEVIVDNDASSDDAAPVVSESGAAPSPPFTAVVSTICKEQASPPKDATNTLPIAELPVGRDWSTSLTGKENQRVIPTNVVGKPVSAVGNDGSTVGNPSGVVGNPGSVAETGASLLAGKENQRRVIPVLSLIHI